jgi:RND superfamily putative drug exporter
LPVPFIRSIGIAGMLIPAVSVLAAITLLPALLAVLGQRINSVRLLPKRLVDHGHPEDGSWGRWARFVNARPVPVAAVGLAITGVLVFYGLQLNANEAQLKNVPGTGDAIVGRDALAAAGITPGVLKPLDVLVENGGDPEAVAERLRRVDGIAAAVAPKDWREGDAAIVEAFPATDGAAPGIQAIIDRSTAALEGTDATVGGTAAVDRDLVHAIYGNFPYLLAFVLALTYILLARAFRSLLLPLKAVLLNLVSLAATFGILVVVFQLGHGSGVWGIDAMQAINPWMPIMIFAFLFGLSMDYEVFMLTRMREAYDETGSTSKAIELGLARTGKLVTSGALVLMCAFLVLSTGPGFLIKELAIGLAAGIIFDATVVRALLVPALMRLLGDANWWLPAWAHRPLLIRAPEELPQAATEST